MLILERDNTHDILNLMESFGKPKDRNLNRRDVLIGAAATAFGLTTLGGIGLKSAETLSENEVTNVSSFLRGEIPEATITFGEHTYSYEEFINVLQKIVTPALTSLEANNRHLVETIAREFGTMMEVEAHFGGTLNNNPAIEWIDQTIEKTGIRVPLASSFGYAQIQPGTAFDVAKKHAESLTREGLLKNDTLETLGEKPSDEKIVSHLALTLNESVLYGFLEFARCFHKYGNRDKTGELTAPIVDDPRGANLALAAYSGNFSAPRVAKVQTYLNELITADQTFKEKWGGPILTVDGSRGENTLKLIDLAREHYNITIPDDVLFEDGSRLWELKNIWEEKTKKLFSDTTEENISSLKNVLMRRYSTAIGTFIAVRDVARAENQDELKKELTQKFQSFIDSRDESFFTFVSNKEQFEESFGKNTFEQFWKRTLSGLREKMKNDENYSGFIPTAFIAPRIPLLGDPGDIMHRAILSEQLRGSSLTRIEGLR